MIEFNIPAPTLEYPHFSFYNADNMEVMKCYPDKYFDLAIVDPPFFKGVANGSFYGSKISKTGVKRLCSKSDVWDKNIPTQIYYDELIRISKNQIIFGINYFNFYNVPHGRIIWDKMNDSSSFSNCEIASNSMCNGVFIYRELWNGMIKSEKGSRQHPTQKPIALYSWLIQKYAKQGDKILDTHLGSGSIALAIDKANKADGMDLDFVGIELDKDYFDSAMKRFSKGRQQMFLNLNV